MAIIIEEEKRGSGILTLLVWVIIIGIIGFGTYAVFFKQPQVVDIIIPDELQNVANISSRIKELQPESIQSDPTFNSLQRWVTVPVKGETGRANPFLAF